MKTYESDYKADIERARQRALAEITRLADLTRHSASLSESLRDVLAGIEDGRVPDGVIKEGWRVLKEYERMMQ